MMCPHVLALVGLLLPRFPKGQWLTKKRMLSEALSNDEVRALAWPKEGVDKLFGRIAVSARNLGPPFSLA